MAKLTAGVQYGLSSQSTFYKNKEVVFVKLTDSAHRTVEYFAQNQQDSDLTPTITFFGNKGEISIPISPDNYNKFTFSIANYQDGGFECIQQTGPKNLESLGTLPCKMQIQANDDVYETTKQRLHVAEENNKNKCTQILKTNEIIRKKGKPFIRKSIAHLNTNFSSKPQESSTLRMPTNHSRFSSIKSNSNLNNSQLKFNDQKKVGAAMNKSLKLRLIHLLALKPFKKLELYDRINREGIKEKEKNTIEKTLKEISILKENAYHLRKYLLREVQEDWPFYTEQEKMIIKKQKPQTNTSSGFGDSSGLNGYNEESNTNHSQNHKFGSGSMNKTNMKDSFGKSNKSKQNLGRNLNKTNNCIKPHTSMSPDKTVLSNENNFKNTYSPKLDSNENSNHAMSDVDMIDYENVNKVIHKPSDVKNSLSGTIKRSDNSNNSTASPYEDRRYTESSDKSRYKPPENLKNSVQDSSTAYIDDIRNYIKDLPAYYGAQLSDFHKDYTTIDNYEQRCRYKEDYYTEYEEYIKLNELVFKIIQHFSSLQEELTKKQQCNDGDGIKFVEQQIKEDYTLTKDIKARHDYLHHKLEHIVKLVSEYDSKANNL